MFRSKVVVREYERGLYYRDGKFIELLPPGRYVHWIWESYQIDCVDIREVSHTIEGQEILTSDKIGVRVTLIAQFKVVDPVVARHSVGDYYGQLYQDLQLTLRESITGRTLEDLLKERDILSGKIQEDVAARAKKYGIELTRVGGAFALRASISVMGLVTGSGIGRTLPMPAFFFSAFFSCCSVLTDDSCAHAVNSG